MFAGRVADSKVGLTLQPRFQPAYLICVFTFDAPVLSCAINEYARTYLRAYETVAEARRLIGRYLDFFNTNRPYSSLGARTPDDA
jgi:hypothetical protein